MALLCPWDVGVLLHVFLRRFVKTFLFVLQICEAGSSVLCSEMCSAIVALHVLYIICHFSELIGGLLKPKHDQPVNS